MLRLAPGPRMVGRAPENGLQLAEMSVSRNHATILVDHDGLVWLTDLGSTNGSFLNGKRLAPHQTVGLRDGDRIGFGPAVVVKFVRPDELDEGYHREMFERTVRDPLTGLFNRAYFHSQIELLAHQTYRRGLGLALLMLDIDNFKRVNDNLGHDAGDQVLREVAATLRLSTRPDDLVARYGGEEFIAALPIGTALQALDRAERIRRDIKNRTILLDRHVLNVTASIGLAYAAADTPTRLARLIESADQALYRAKFAGRDCVQSARDHFQEVSLASDDEIPIPSEDSPPPTGHTLTTIDFEIFRP
jgi:diguanylate cyclase (GGDEF)-like protein